MADPRERYLINSILRACAILKCLAKEKPRCKAGELARRLGLDRSTTYRVLLSLEKCGLVEKDPQTGAYSLGLAAFEVGSAYLRSADLFSAARPIMLGLAGRVEETVHLAVLSETEAMYLDKVDSPRGLGTISKVGKRVPLHCSGIGKTLLAFQPPEVRERLVAAIELTRFTPRTITSREELKRELDRIRARGYALDEEEHEPDIACVAAPILDHQGGVLASLSVSGPSQRVNDPDRVASLILEVQRASQQVSDRMGYQG